MTCSAARLGSDRENALLAMGAGEAGCRRAGLVGGLTGDGVALPNEDQAEVDRRFAAMAAELGAVTELGRALVQRAAMLTVRLERGYRNEAARLSLAVDGAARAFEDGRLATIEKLMDTIADDPATNARRLQQTAEGVRYTIEAWKALKVDLVQPEQKLWTAQHWERAENLMGRQTTDVPQSRIGALSRALWYDFSALNEGEAAGLNERGRYEYARDCLVEIIDGRVETLGTLADGFDEAATDRARLGAADRALFDASKESILARKFEAATERSLFRTLRELREVEADARGGRKPADPAGGEAGPGEGGPALGSFGAGSARGDREARPATRQASGRPRDIQKAARQARDRARRIDKAARGR